MKSTPRECRNKIPQSSPDIKRRVENVKTQEPPHDKTNKMACAPSEDSDQPGYPPSLIRVLAVRMKKAWFLSYPLSAQPEGQILIDIMNDHGLEQMVHFPTREKNTLDLILTTLPGQFQDVHSPDKLSDHDIVSGTLKIFIPPIKKPRRKVYLYQKGDYESMRKDTLEFAKEKYFNGHSDTRSVQENFDLLTSFIQDSADKHIPSKTSRSVSSVPWITPEIRRKIRRRNKTHAKAKKTGSSKLRSKFKTLRREIKAEVRKQHDLYVNNLVGDVKANPRDFYRYINSQKKTHTRYSTPEKEKWKGCCSVGSRKGRGIEWSVYGCVQ